MGKVILLERLAQEMGCDCLSDLRLKQEEWSSKMITVLKNESLDEYSLSEWIEMISYLTNAEENVFNNMKESRQAKEYILKWLESGKTTV